VGFVEFSNTNTNTFYIFYYTQSFEERFVDQKTHFQLAKMPKMNIFKHLRNKYLKKISLLKKSLYKSLEVVFAFYYSNILDFNAWKLISRQSNESVLHIFLKYFNVQFFILSSRLCDSYLSQLLFI
jgi:NAD+--asparagine ADP-ribosyltransferase